MKRRCPKCGHLQENSYRRGNKRGVNHWEPRPRWDAREIVPYREPWMERWRREVWKQE